MQPLPYPLIVNLLDLYVQQATALLALGTYRLYSAESDRFAHWHQHVPIVAALAGYVWFNLMLPLRSAAHYLDISYRFEPLFLHQSGRPVLSLA